MFFFLFCLETRFKVVREVLESGSEKFSFPWTAARYPDRDLRFTLHPSPFGTFKVLGNSAPPPLDEDLICLAIRKIPQPAFQCKWKNLFFFWSRLNRTDHTKFAKCCEVVHCDRLADESYYSREVRNVREVFSLKTAVHFNAEAQGRKVTQRKSGLLWKRTKMIIFWRHESSPIGCWW